MNQKAKIYDIEITDHFKLYISFHCGRCDFDTCIIMVAYIKQINKLCIGRVETLCAKCSHQSELFNICDFESSY